MANIKISQLVLSTPGPESIFPFTDNGATYKGFISGLTTNYIEVTKNELIALVLTSSLTPGYFYIIEGVDVNLYGGTTIILEAVSNDKLSDYGSGIFYNPKYDQSIDGYGIWTRLMTPVFNSISNGSFQYGETVVSDSGDTATFIGNELLSWVNGPWSGSLSITGLTSGAEASIESYSRPNYLLGDTVIWGGKHWINSGGTVLNEVISTGDGTSSYSGYTNLSPIGPFTFNITTSVEDFSDDGSGNLTGTGGGTGTIDYDLGLWSITAFTSISSGTPITSSYIATPVGNYIDKYTLNSVWSEIDYNQVDYNVVADEIRYDFTNDKIIYRKDYFGNEVSCDYQIISQFEIDSLNGLGNPIKDFQWGNNQTNWGITPGLYLFNDVSSTSDDIENGGNDLLDIGNILNTENFTQIPYTHTQMTNPPITPSNPAGEVNYIMDGVVSSGDSYFGAFSEYFTNLYPGLFVMAAHGTSIDNFFIDGFVGADCDGELDDYQNTYTGYSSTYTAYVKRYFNNSNLEPSNNHIIIVNSDGTGITHDFTSGGCDSDYDSVSGLTSSGVNRIYYLLMSQFPNEKISDLDIDEVVNVFLNIVDNQTIGDSLTSLNNNYTNITNLFSNYQTLDKFGIMNNKVVDSYMDCLNFVGGYIWNNNLTQNSIFANNIFSPIRKPYFSDNILSISSLFNNNIVTSESLIRNNILVNSEVSDNSFNGLSVATSDMENNLLNNSIITLNNLSNSSINLNQLNLNSSISSNTIINSEIENNVLETQSAIGQNILIDSLISSNEINQNSSIYMNDLANSYIGHNLIGQSSSINDNQFINNGSVSYNSVLNESSFNNNALIDNCSIQNNTINQNSSVQYNTGYTNSYIQSNNLFYSFISGNTLDDGSYIQENRINNYSEITSNNLVSSSFISNNEINNESYILENYILSNSEFIHNYLNTSYIYNNTSSASTISQNSCNVSSEIYSNNLTSSNIWKNKLEIESSVYNGIFISSDFSYNSLKNSTVDLSSSCVINSKFITKTNFVDSVVNDISENSSVIYDTYSKNVFTNSTGGTRISYYDSTDTLIIGNINDSVLPTFYISAWTATSITSVDVTIDITLDGGSSITERGVVWSSSEYPTVADNTVVDGGTGIGSYTNTISGFISGDTVYFRGYAVNSSGTGYTCQDHYSSLIE